MDGVESSNAAVRISRITSIGGEQVVAQAVVEYHRAVIAAVDQLLIPNARNAERKETLVSVRPALVAHLQHAEHLLAGLK